MAFHHPVPVEQFCLDGALRSLRPCGNGHINRTWRAVTDTGAEYLIQLVNTDVFRNVDGLMENISRVTEHVREKIRADGGDPDRETMLIVPTLDGKLYCMTKEGCYRAYHFIRNAIALEKPRSAEDFYLTARAFGKFQQQLLDFPAAELAEVIPDFHNTPKRLQALELAAKMDVMGRKKDVEAELNFIFERQVFAGILTRGIESGALPLRVTHNDTKLNNLLFDNDTMTPLAVVDLDTVMPGTSLYDFGDGIRYGAATAAEDEMDLSLVSCDLELYGHFVRGWASVCGDTMTAGEKELLHLSPRVLTLECGARFLTDYLSGDTYFSTSRPGQNLDRCRTQLKLVADMEAKEAEMLRLSKKYLQF